MNSSFVIKCEFTLFLCPTMDKKGVMRMWSNLIGSVIVLVGVCASLDSRRLVRKYFDFGEENTAVVGLKIFGILVTLAGAMLIILSR